MSLRVALLGLLDKQPGSGYDLTRRFDQGLRHVWHARHSQIYPELARMAADGLVVADDEGPRGRRVYSITEAGRAELRRWLRDVEPQRSRRDDGALRAFLLPVLAAPDAVRHLRREEKAYSEAVAELEQIVARLDDETGEADPRGYGRLAAELGIRQYGAVRDWARWAADQIDAAEVTEGSEQSRPGEP